MPTHLSGDWNIFASALVHDLDGDEVSEIVAIHGGDTNYKPEVCEGKSLQSLWFAACLVPTQGRLRLRIRKTDVTLNSTDQV